MTPEEKAVIDAAINWLTVGTRAKEFGLCEEERFLTGAVQSLIYVREHEDVPPLHPDTVITRESSGATAMKIERWQGDPKVWTPATFLYALAGDRIRIGTDETDVLRSSSGAWHANVVSSVLPSGKTWDKVTPWEHTELRLDLSANPGFREYPADTPCEILCTPERLAVLTLMTVFPGTKEIKP